MQRYENVSIRARPIERAIPSFSYFFSKLGNVSIRARPIERAIRQVLDGVLVAVGFNPRPPN